MTAHLGRSLLHPDRAVLVPGPDELRELPALGTLLCDRYRLEHELARGGSAVIYRATDTLLGQTVALKLLLRRGALSSSTPAAALREEAISAMRLSHPLILRVHHYEQHPPWELLVMELVVGETLTERLRRSPARHLSAIETVTIGLDCLDALEYAHGAGVVHNDIKPGNLLWTDMGTLKVCDFGLARLLAQPARRLVCGTPGFMAPEVQLGAPGTPKSDLFSLAATLYVLGNGRLMMSRELDGTYDGPAPSVHLAPSVHELICLAAAADPAHRFSSAAEMREALLRVKEALSSG